MLTTIRITSTIPDPNTLPTAANALAVSSLSDQGNTLEITGKATVGSGSLVLLRWFADLGEWRPWREYHTITADSSKLGGFFSGAYAIPGGDEFFLLYTTDSVTATAVAQVRLY